MCYSLSLDYGELTDEKTVDGQPFKWIRRPSICDEGRSQGVLTYFFLMIQGKVGDD